jgi:hypothetical protein
VPQRAAASTRGGLDSVRPFTPIISLRLIKSARRRLHRWLDERSTLDRLRHRAPLPPAADPGHIIFFAPEAGVRPHYSAQLVLARCLKNRGHAVAVVQCFRSLCRCPVMDLHGLPVNLSDREQRSFCLQCCAAAHSAQDEHGIPFVDLRTLQDGLDQAAIDAVRENATQNPLEFTFDGKPFGKLCALDLTLACKIADFSQITAAQRSLWLTYIAASVQAYQLTHCLLDRLPVRKFVCFNDYSVFLGVRLAAEGRGVAVMSITQATHRNIDRRKYVFYKQPSTITCVQQAKDWPRWRSLPLNPKRVDDIGSDIFERFRGIGSHVYSPAKTFVQTDLQAQLQLDAGKKLLVAYTSSLDEFRAAGLLRDAMKFEPLSTRTPFPDQLQWIQALIADTESRCDRNLIVRVHPREGVNKREKISSPHLELLRKVLDRPYKNCRVIWPQEQVSSYDLAELADVALTSWSNIGLELARMGVPVVASAHGHMETPDDDFLNWGATPDAYFRKIDEVLERRPTLGPIIRAFRWYNLVHLGTALDLGDVIPHSHYEDVPPDRQPQEAQAIEQILVDHCDVLELNRTRLQAEQTGESEAEEIEAVRRFLRRLIILLMTGKEATEDRLTHLSYDTEGAACSGNRMESVWPAVRMRYEGREWSRRSPLVGRLVPLVQGTVE